MTDEQTTPEPTTPPENPAKSRREWEAFFAKWGSVQPEPAKADAEIDLFL